MDKTGFNKSQYMIGIVILCAAVALGIIAYVGMNNASEENGGPIALNATGATAGGNLAAGNNLGTNKSTNQTGQNMPVQPNGNFSAAGNDTRAAAKEVVIDFLYADWCGHCQTMKPIVARLETTLPRDRFEVRYWNEASRNDATVAAVYATYTDAGYFTGFPTFVANGDDSRAGSMPEATFKEWVCSKFSSPKPAGC